MLAKRPALTVVMVLTLALGIGANSAIFSVVNAVLLRPLPFNDPDRLVLVWSNLPGSNVERDSHSLPNFRDLSEHSVCFEGLVGMGYPFSSSLSGEGAPVAVKMAGLTPGFFSLLGIEPGLGREFSQKDLPSAASSGSVPTVQATPLILSHGLWVSRFGGDPGILGRKVQVNGAPMTVVGVMPADTRFFQMLKAAGLGINDDLQAWLPLNTRNPNWPRHLRTIRVLGRLKQGLTVAQAQQQVDSLSKRMREQHLELSQSGFRFELAPLRSGPSSCGWWEWLSTSATTTRDAPAVPPSTSRPPIALSPASWTWWCEGVPEPTWQRQCSRASANWTRICPWPKSAPWELTWTNRWPPCASAFP